MSGNREGYCKLCSSPLAYAVNKLIADGKNASEAQKILEPLGLTFVRQVYYKHKDHVTHPLITAVQKAKQNPVIVPASTHAALETIRDLGMQKAIDNPEEVTVDHALKAASILQQSEKKADSFLVVLAKSVQAEAEPEYIEGDYKEITTSGES